MEAVGARLGRSSSRYGTTTVFNGPVRKWKKKWIHVSPPPPPPSTQHQHHNNNSLPTSSSSPHLLLFKWTPLSHTTPDNPINNDAAPDPVAPPKRKFRYIPVAALEELQKDTEVISDDEAKPTDTDAAELTSKSDGGHYGNPDINDIPMEEDEDEENDDTVQDLNKSTLDLSLG